VTAVADLGKSLKQGLYLAAAGVALAVFTHPSHATGADTASTSQGSQRWPFPKRDWSQQFRQVDEGIDLQYPGTTPVPVRAVAAGKVVVLGPDPAKDGGFGTAYPGLVLDHPVTVGGSTFTEIYYGHTFPAPGKVGHHVHRGEVIGHTGGAHSGGNAYSDSNWLEIGFFPPSYAHGPLMRKWLSLGAGGNRG